MHAGWPTKGGSPAQEIGRPSLLPHMASAPHLMSWHSQTVAKAPQPSSRTAWYRALNTSPSRTGWWPPVGTITKKHYCYPAGATEDSSPRGTARWVPVTSSGMGRAWYDLTSGLRTDLGAALLAHPPAPALPWQCPSRSW